MQVDTTSVVVMSGATWPWSGSDGHRKASIKRQNFTLDDDANGIHLRPAHEIMFERWSPPHRHTFEQIRLQLGGEQYYADEKWVAGTFGYFPESVFYGPHKTESAEVEEIDLQFPSPTGRPFFSTALLVGAMGALKEQGVRFVDGIAHHPDGRQQDSTEACWEHLCGGEVPYAPPRYDKPVVLHTQHLDWRDTGRPGVSLKHLGLFGDAGPNVGLLRLEPGASTAPGREGFYQVRFVVDGEATYAGQACPRVSCLYYPPSAPYEGLSTRDGATVLVVQIQAPNGVAPTRDSLQ